MAIGGSSRDDSRDSEGVRDSVFMLCFSSSTALSYDERERDDDDDDVEYSWDDDDDDREDEDEEDEDEDEEGEGEGVEEDREEGGERCLVSESIVVWLDVVRWVGWVWGGWVV